MTWLGDIDLLRRLWNWAQGSMLKRFLAIIAILGSVTIVLTFAVLYILSTFYETEDRWNVLSEWLSKIMGWFGIGAEWINANLIAFSMVAITLLLSAIIITCILSWCMSQVWKVNNENKGYKEVIHNLYTALDKLSKFPYDDGTPTGKDAAYVMGYGSIKKGVPSPQKLDQVIERVKGKDANIAELVERAKKEIDSKGLYKP